MKFYDVDGDGNITYDEFVRGLREPLSERRLAMVKRAFALMDKDGSGQVTVSDIAKVYDVTQNKEFKEGKKSKEEVLEDFLSGFEGVKGNRDGTITWEEWLDYYSDLSMSMPDDLYFVRMMEQVWCVAEDESSTVYKEQLERLTQLMRQKLQDFSKQGHSDEYVLRDVFKLFDTNKSGDLTIDELWNMMAKLGISCERKYVQALFRKFDENNNGVIEFEEFCRYLIQNPYK